MLYSLETKYLHKLKNKTQNNIVIFEIFHKKMIMLFWLFLKQFDLNTIVVYKKINILVFVFLVFRLSNG